jgi:hypothetical protein
MNIIPATADPPASPGEIDPGIRFDGRYYYYREYRYDRLEDARRYAALTREHPERRVVRQVLYQPAAWHAPTPGEQVMMRELGIGFDGRAFLVGAYRYEHFREAARYVLAQRPAPPLGAPRPAPLSARDIHREAVLDAALAATFPASDPLASFTP